MWVRFLLAGPYANTLSLDIVLGCKDCTPPLRKVLSVFAYDSGFGEMDIITVFETAGRGSIPLSPANNIFWIKLIKFMLTH